MREEKYRERERARMRAQASERQSMRFLGIHTHKHENTRMYRQTDRQTDAFHRGVGRIPSVFTRIHALLYAQQHSAHTHTREYIYTYTYTTTQPHTITPSQSRTRFLGIHSGCITTCATSSIFSAVVWVCIQV